MNETLLNIFASIFYLSEQQGAKLCYNTETGQICRVLDEKNGVFTLLPTAGGDAPTSYFSPASLIFRTDILTRSAKIRKLTALNSIETGEERIANSLPTENSTEAKQIENGPTTASQRDKNGNCTDAKRQFVGAGTVNLPRISNLYAGELAVVVADCEQALDKIFFSTNKEATIKKYIARYDDLKRYAAAGNLYECKLLLKSLNGTIEKQKAMAKGVEKFERKATLKKRAVNALIIFIFILGAIFYFRPWQRTTSDNAAGLTPTPPAAMVTGVNLSPFEAAVREFEAETGKKIYPAGRACLQNTAARLGLTTKQQIKNLIKSNVK